MKLAASGALKLPFIRRGKCGAEEIRSRCRACPRGARSGATVVPFVGLPMRLHRLTGAICGFRNESCEFVVEGLRGGEQWRIFLDDHE